MEKKIKCFVLYGNVVGHEDFNVLIGLVSIGSTWNAFVSVVWEVLDYMIMPARDLQPVGIETSLQPTKILTPFILFIYFSLLIIF